MLEDLEPFVTRALEVFGAGRLMIGSDWPVCALAADYVTTISTYREAIGSLSAGEQLAILGENAATLYRIGS